jgi:hypothetical protein
MYIHAVFDMSDAVQPTTLLPGNPTTMLVPIKKCMLFNSCRALVCWVCCAAAAAAAVVVKTVERCTDGPVGSVRG